MRVVFIVFLEMLHLENDVAFPLIHGTNGFKSGNAPQMQMS